MARAEFRAILLGVAASGLLTACVDSTGDAGATGGIFAAPATGTSNREVEAPEVFETTDSALWDGRPSLGGIWVASPDVASPERVVMYNPATGKSVNGALFKRERDNPGPKLQISSDAAEALGILAGQPTEIRVTALRKVEVAVPADAEAAVGADPAMEGAAPVAEATDAAAETAALATAALDAADAGTTTAEAAPAAEAEAAPVEPPKKTWKERRAEAKAKREAEKAAKAAAAAEAAGEAPVEGPDAVDPAASAVAAIETAPLDARAPEAEAEAATAPAEPATAPAPAEEAPAAEPAPAATATRTIQIATFSKEDNAKRAVEALSKIGITAEPKKSEVGGKPVWGVVTRGDSATLQKIKDAGFADAYFLK